MLLCETFDWLLWIRPIESLLGVNSVPSHASGKHAWVSWHGYQPPPLFIRSPTSSTSAVRSRINTAGPISTYMTIPPPPPPPPSLITTQTLSPHLSHTEIQHALCLACTGFSLCLLSETFRPIPNTHTHTHHVDTHCHTHTCITVTNITSKTAEALFSSRCRRVRGMVR